ncbi:hypothetical protein MHA01_10890 [Marinococcus halophilus]|uniref:Uncharacterized protein n=1 Tax=Marinococcus halophilus TaxID=1371 RepID=A0A510Y4E3_MARHA|nr:hypothetical protein MHA01_10890 [Marinococcus halophilus]
MEEAGFAVACKGGGKHEKQVFTNFDVFSSRYAYWGLTASFGKLI